MIRLDGNSLAAFRGAGVDGFSQRVAGCLVHQASPYSWAATAALKAQFPTQWATIRDYGFAHPEIVGYMNAYAPEDAKIAYSLVEGIGTRWLVGDGTARIDTGMYLNSTDVDVELKLKSPATLGGNNSYIGILRLVSGSVNGILQLIYYWQNNQISVNVRGSGAGVVIPFTTNTEYAIDYKSSTGAFVINGTSYAVGAVKDTIPDSVGTIPLFSYNYNGSYTGLSGGTGAYKSAYTIIRVGNVTKHFVPYKKNGAMGMIDLLTGTFYGNANSSGSFSESIESPA